MLYFRDSSHFPVIGDLAMAYSPGIHCCTRQPRVDLEVPACLSRGNDLRPSAEAHKSSILRSLSLHVYQIIVTL